MKTEAEIRNKVGEYEKEALDHYLYEKGKVFDGSFKKILKSKVKLLKWVLEEDEN